MKKILLGALLLLSTFTFSQNVCKNIDEFTNKVSYLVDKNIVIKEGEKAFSITPYLKEYKGNVIFSELIIKSIGVSCVDVGSTLIIIFENGEKETFNSWNKFNCDGTSYMSLTVKGSDLFQKHKILKVQFQNSRNFNNISGVFTKIDQSYFLDLYSSLKLQNFKECDFK